MIEKSELVINEIIYKNIGIFIIFFFQKNIYTLFKLNIEN